MALGYSTVSYYDTGAGHWVEESPATSNGGMVGFTYTDTLYEPAMLEVLIADPENTRLSTYQTPYRYVMLKEKDTEAVLFIGRVIYCEPKFDGEYGQIIKITAFDHLHELRDTWMRQPTNSVYPSDIVLDCIRTGSWTKIPYTGKVGAGYTQGLWVMDWSGGGSTGVFAQIVRDVPSGGGAGYVIVNNYYYTSGATADDFTPGGTLYEVCHPLLSLFTFTNATTGTVWRKIDISAKTGMDASDVALDTSPKFSGVGGSCLEEMGNYAKLDKYNTTAVGVGHVYMLTPTDVTGPDFEQDFLYFHRQKYLGLNASTLVPEAGGHDPCEPADHGLILQFGATAEPSGGDPVGPPPVPPDAYYGRWKNIAPNYEFSPRYMGEIVTRVRYHYRGRSDGDISSPSDGAAVEQQVTSSNTGTLEDTYQTVHEKHVYNFATTMWADAVSLGSRILESLCVSGGITRGRVTIAGYPAYWDVNPVTYALENPRIIRAGCMVHVLHTKIASVNAVNFLVTEVQYSEPSGEAQLSLMDKQYGMEELKYDPGENVTEVSRVASVSQKQSSALAGQNTDDIAPVKPSQINGGGDPDDTIPCPVGTAGYWSVKLDWHAWYERVYRQGGAAGTQKTELDISHFEVWRHTADAFSEADPFNVAACHMVAQTKAAYYVDADPTLVLATDYYYWIKAVDVAGNRSEVSKGSGAVQIGAMPIFPVGYIYISVDPTNPATTLGFGTWVAFGEGKTLVSLDAADHGPVDPLDTVRNTGGSKTHTLVVGEMPAHTHTMSHTHTMKNHTHSMSHTHQIDPPNTTSGGQSQDHTHTTTITTGTESADHSHSGTTAIESADHAHYVSGTTGGESGHTHSDLTLDGTGVTDPNAPSGYFATTGGTTGASSGHTHSFAAWSGGVSANHTHTITTGGRSATHTHSGTGTSGSVSQGHTHNINIGEFTSGGASSSDTGGPSDNTTDGSSASDTGSAGTDGAHQNMMPYIVVYMWERVA